MSTESLVAQARAHAGVEPRLDAAAREALAAGAASLASAARGGQVYGLTTGVGALRDGRRRRERRRRAPPVAQPRGPVRPRAGRRRSPGHDAGPAAPAAAGPAGVYRGAGRRRSSGRAGAGAVPVLHGYGSIGTADLSALAELGLALVGEGPWRSGTAPAAAVSAADALPFMSSNAMTADAARSPMTDLAGPLAAPPSGSRPCRTWRCAARPQAYDPRVFAGQGRPGTPRRWPRACPLCCPGRRASRGPGAGPVRAAHAAAGARRRGRRRWRGRAGAGRRDRRGRGRTRCRSTAPRCTTVSS